MPVSPDLTPVQRLAAGRPGIPGHDSYARSDTDTVSPQGLLRPPRRDARWMAVTLVSLSGIGIALFGLFR